MKLTAVATVVATSSPDTPVKDELLTMMPIAVASPAQPVNDQLLITTATMVCRDSIIM